MQKTKARFLFLKGLKVVAWIFASFIILFLVITLLLQFSSVQTWLIHKITSQVSDRIETPFTIDEVAIRFPKSVGLKGIYLEDTQGDTLLYAGSIFVDVGMMGLFRSKVNVKSLELSDVVANMKREEPDTVFNYQFLIKAFAPKDTTSTSPPPDAEKASQEEQADQEGGWTVAVKKLSLENIRFRNKDHFSGLDLQVQLDNLNADLRPADFMNQKFHAGEIRISQPHIAMQMTPPSVPSEPDSAAGMPVLDIAIKALILENPDFRLNSFDGTEMHINSALLALHPEKISLHEFLIAIEELEADQLVADFIFPKKAENGENSQAKDPATEEAPPPFRFDFAEILEWSIELDKLDITASSFSMKQGAPQATRQFNPAHISLTDINLHLSNVKVTPDQVILAISNTSMVFSDEFRIADFNMELDLGSSSEIHLQNLTTDLSNISISLNTPGSLLDFSQEDLTGYSYQLSIQETHIQQDLAWFVPVMNEYYFNWPGNKGVRMGARMEGKMADIRIDSLWLAGPDFFATQLSGQITGLPNTDSLYVDIPELSFFAVPGEFFANLPDSLRPQGFEIPEYINLKAQATGSMADFNADANLRSDLGNFTLSAQIDDEVDGKEIFEAALYTESFDLGKLLQQTEQFSEPLAFRLTLNGKGLKPETMTLEAAAEIDNLVYNEHSYDKIVFNASLIDSLASLQSVYEDTIISYDLDATYGIFQQNPELTTNFLLEYANLQALGLAEENLLVKTELKTDLVFKEKDFFNGTIQVSNTSFAAEGDIYAVPEIFVEALTTQSNYEIALRSQFADLDYRGNFSPLKLGTVLNEHFEQYYMASEEPDTLSPDTEQFFNVSIRVMPNELITEVLLRSLGETDTLDVMFSYDSSLETLYLEASWPEARFADTELDSLNITAESVRGELDFEVLLNRISRGNITLNHFNTSGNISDQTLDFGIGFQDRENNPLYNIAGKLEAADSLYSLQINRDNLLINGEAWNIPEGNQVSFGGEHIHIQDFILKSKGRQISMATREHEDDYPIIDILFEQIDLGRLTEIPGKDFPTLDGLFQGDISLINIFEEPAFIADLTIDNFAFEGDTIGNIVVKAENPQGDIYELFASVQSKVTDMEITGNYRTGEDPGISIDADLARLDLSSFESFTFGNLKQLEGFLSGNIKISGTTEEPLINGELIINETSFEISALSTGYSLEKEKILFDNSNIRLQRITLQDSKGQKANLNGTINFGEMDQLTFDLNLKSNNFQLMNAPPGQNDIYHGRILMDSDLQLKGNQSSPVIEGSIKLNEGSNFTFALPQSNPEAIGDEGVVEFVEFGDTLFYQMAMQSAETSPVTSSFKRLEASINIDVDPKTDVKIIIDEYAGDFLQVRGGAQLSFGMDPGGRISLSGRYEMEGGEYLLTFYDVVRRNFIIQSGSNIVWSGDPLHADIDITAIYTVRTNAMNLMAGQMSQDQDQSEAMRQQFPFLVYLKMRGNLETPEISFELNLPNEHQNAMDGTIMGRINQINQNESELNKQVFALLILGNFIQENPFASAGGGDFSTTARSSASQILTQQLNKLSDRYIKGVDINFEVESFVDYEDGQEAGRTQLQMEVSRRFLDERIRVTVGGNIELEDESRQERSASDIAGDVSIEYLITPEGNLRLKGFRTKTYGDIFDGEIVETGISVIFSRSYNRFRELFKKEEETTIEEEQDN